ncbi:NAB3 [Candida pseudojiufengensis]|uniref:NAB3 n=1 Tax=Candida pseudojiufengensis TaxID=497109 RepID=UPI0022252C19|nr:NAB3 [Candida pseudojiufengensis]KAI5963130.1 NAB3 [Candida pseudojiufengensis]
MEVNPITLHRKGSERSPSTETKSVDEVNDNSSINQPVTDEKEDISVDKFVVNESQNESDKEQVGSTNDKKTDEIHEETYDRETDKTHDASESSPLILESNTQKKKKSVRIVEQPKVIEDQALEGQTSDDESDGDIGEEQNEDKVERFKTDEVDNGPPEVSLTENPHGEQTNNQSNDEKKDDDDEYDPEIDQPAVPNLPPKPSLPTTSSSKTTPQTSNLPKASDSVIRQAFEYIIQDEIAKNAEILQLGLDQQAQIFQKRIDSLGDSFPGSHMNYNQVYSYNKPFKNLKDPVPLIPINEYCRRPNITAPMSEEEEQEYEDFIERENHYMNLQNWDEFPDKSRLFVGNLPANTISKQDLFRIFSKYGEVIQIAIKAGYGFTQFRTAEACMECIKGEEGVPLHNKTLRLDASKPQKSRRSGNPEVNNPNFNGRGRERQADDEPSRKRIKGNCDCSVFITGKSSVFFIRKVKKTFANAQITVDTEDVTQKNITDVLSEAAYSGVLGACVIKEQKVDLQTYETQLNGGIKFDEYADIDPEEAAEIMTKVKLAKYGDNPPPYFPQDTSYNDNDKHNNKTGGRHHHNENNRGRNFGNRGGKGGRGGKGRFNDNFNRNRNNFNQNWSNDNQIPQQQPYIPQQQPYGQVPQAQFSPYIPQVPPQQHQDYNPYGAPQLQAPPQPNFNQYGVPIPQPHQPAPSNQNYLQTLQSLDPAQVQNMINLLQQQQQQQHGTSPLMSMNPAQQPPPQPQPSFRGPTINYGSSDLRRDGRGPRGNYGPNPVNNQPYGNVPQPHQTTTPNPNSRYNNPIQNNAQATGPNALLSRLQSNQTQNANSSYSQPQSNQQDSNASLLETLQKLSGN